MVTAPPTTHLDFYASAGVMADLTPHVQLIDELPRDIASLAKVVQGLVVHRFWADAYKTTIDERRDKEQGIRSASAMVKRMIEIDPRPLTMRRVPNRRVVGICRHFATLLTAFLRYQGIPARARCGFASYFEPGKYVDHWVTEYWNDTERRWIMVDSQLDGLQVAIVKPDFDPLDVPHQRFWVAGQAWQRVRRGEVDGNLFGIAHMWGQWFVGGDLRLDVCSLNKVELLPWDVERLPHTVPDELLDEVAALSTGDAAAIDRLRELYARDDRLGVTEETMASMIRDDIAGTGQSNTIKSG